jgi:hypothetical protein
MSDMQIFLDMDQTISAFNKAVQKLGPEAAQGLPEDSTEEQQACMFEAIREAGEAFWRTMEWMDDGKSLWKLLQPFHPTILTSIGIDLTGAESGKKAWIQKHIPGTPIFFSNTKSEYVNPYVTCILVDDNKNNIASWEEAGGIGILHTSTESTERQFLDLLWNQRG